MRINMAVCGSLVVLLMLFFAGACTRDTYEPEELASAAILTQGPEGTELDEVDVFGFKRTERGIVVNPSASESLQIDLYDPQSFWDNASDQNWMEYGDW